MASTKTKAKSSGGRKIKYLGSSHVRILRAGENFGGQLADPLEKDVVWDLNNNHIIDTAESGLSEAAVSLLLAQEGDMFDSGQYDEDDPEVPTDENTIITMAEFADVTDQSIIEPSLGQQIFLGMKAQDAEVALRQSEDRSAPVTSAATSATMASSGAAVVTGATVDAGGVPTTTVGGSTDGAGGDTGASSAT